MTRREISRLAVLGAVAWPRGFAPRAFAQKAAAKTEPVTDYVARFIVNTRYEDIPSDVIELARKSILDGLGLALCGSTAETGEIVRQYIKSLGFAPGTAGLATVIGSSMKAPVRFAAFANAVGIHADDYDDTQLAVAEDRDFWIVDASDCAGASGGARGGRNAILIGPGSAIGLQRRRGSGVQDRGGDFAAALPGRLPFDGHHWRDGRRHRSGEIESLRPDARAHHSGHRRE